MVRLARLEDIPRLLMLGRAFYEQTRLATVAEYDDVSTADFLFGLITGPISTVFVAERGGQVVGGIGGAVVPCYWNRRHVIGQQMFLYLEPGYRGPAVVGLLRGWESWAREHGADILMSGWKDECESLGNTEYFLMRMGYVPLEHTCVKGVQACRQQA